MDNNHYEDEIDLSRMFAMLLRHIKFILLISILCGAAGFAVAAFAITPLYQSSVRLYVNNSSFNLGSANVSISPNELTAAKSLVDVYIIILDSKPTLMEVIDEAGLEYTHEELKEMITASAVNGTEVFEVTVTSPDPYEAEKIANCISDVLPDKVAEIVDGTSVRLVDYAEVAGKKSSPNVTMFTAVGLAVGCVLSVLLVLVREMTDDVIHEADFLSDYYPDIPLMASIPDLADTSSDNYGKYYEGYESSGEQMGGRHY